MITKIKQLSIPVVVVLMSIMMVLSPVAINSTSGATQPKYDPAIVTMHADGDFTPDLSILENYDVPESVLYQSLHTSDDIDYRIQFEGELKEQGFHELYFDNDKRAWRVSFTTILEAPLIDIWEDEIKDNDGPSLSSEEVNVGPTESARSEKAMGLPFFYGDISYLLENDTDDSAASWNYTDDFNLDNYDLLSVTDIGDYNANNLSIVVSYVENLSYTNLNATYAYNKTIINEPVDGYQDFWFRLDLENSNSSFDEYVANVEFKNFDVRGGRYIASVDANSTDSRYDTNYVGTLTESVSVNSADQFNSQYKASMTTSQGLSPNGLELSGWFDGTSTSDVLNVASDFAKTSIAVSNEARGWEDEDDLEESVKQSIVDKSEDDDYTSITQLDDLTLSDSIMKWSMNDDLMSSVGNVVNSAVDKYDTVKNVVDEVKDKVVPRVSFSTDVKAENIKEDSKEGNEATDATNGVVAAENEEASSFGKGVTNWITDTAGAIADGAVSVWTTVQDKLDEISPGLGNILPYILLGTVFVIILLIYFWRKPTM